MQVCAQNYSGTRFITPSQSPILGPSPDLGPSGDWEAISTDYSGVRPCDRSCNMVFNPAIHVQNGFVHFRCHESNQTHEYDQGLLSKHIINRKNKRRKCFCFSWQCLPCLSFFCSPIDAGAYQLVHSCRFPRPNIQI